MHLPCKHAMNVVNATAVDSRAWVKGLVIVRATCLAWPLSPVAVHSGLQQCWDQ